MIITKLLSIVLVGYLLGSIPVGLLIGKYYSRVDIRKYGSGKTGTTNVLRAVGRKAAILALVLDASKGALAVLFAALIFGRNYLVVGNFGLGLLVAQCLAALAAMAGHNWSVFLKFKGGRGVATFFGGLIALSPVVALFGGQVFIIGIGLTRFASLGSIAGVVGTYSILIPLTIFNGFPIEYLIYTLIGTIVIIIMHRDNIARLLAGKERKVGEKAEAIGTSPPGKNTE
ncbi:MAG: glycerol-3-phosphate 1-O-acyltransferase PlsY [Dehalococcoidales bacterium]|jgi:glycerol-3-phosphate acyltransferase PlsY|nr:acyl-phosphate glycerol 3-phosphate acyltransferase [Dehalococcoidales bacterium]MDP6501326.1 glycerol-3-phosphate 1-O-acyltransferase PlsY [Dehalococcoidales bacterium]MDP6631924.1 glycerol-3-phosphate 1-O-acyltransferase PlsY [Dehalococcoidales bacterium]